MKIIGVTTFPVAVPAPHRGGRVWLFLRLDTDVGISGYGEVYMISAVFSPLMMAAMVEDLVQHRFVGRNPEDTELLLETNLSAAVSGYGRLTEHTVLAILSGIEMACWDIIGKDVGRPIFRLLGGAVRDRVRTYTYLYPREDSKTQEQLWVEPQEAAARALEYTDEGFTGVKLDPFGTDVRAQGLGQRAPVQFSVEALDTAEEVIRCIREAVGSRCDIMIGTHAQMTAAGAIRLARRLEKFDPLWFEEPVPPENMAEMALVARATTIPIATGERLTTKFDFARLIEYQAAAIFNFDIGQIGGILEAKKIAGMAEAHYVQISPHLYSGPLIAAASLQIAMCCPNFLIMESIEKLDGFHADLLVTPLIWQDGYLIPSGLPGLGHDLTDAVALRHAVR
jgi:galactonate dehydratase